MPESFSMLDSSLLSIAVEDARDRWSSPWPGFTSGQDPRTSDNALLAQLYGGVERAARQDWQNAGRRLVDKTYIHMLWHVMDLLPLQAVSPERIAAELDPFVRGPLADLRPQISALNSEERWQRARDLVQLASRTLFGSLTSEVAASRLLFFLCPQLPVMPMTRSALITFGLPVDTSYQTYAEMVSSALSELRVDSPCPEVVFGDHRDRDAVDTVLSEGDWWHRRVLHSAFLRWKDHPVACDASGNL